MRVVALSVPGRVRLKHRYVVAQLLLDPGGGGGGGGGEGGELASRDVIAAVRERLQVLYGDMGAGEFGGNTVIKFYDANTQLVVVRTAREAEHSVRLALATVTQIKRTALVVRTLCVAGSGRTCLDKLRALLRRALEAEAVVGRLDEATRLRRQEQYESLMQTLEL